MDEKESAKLPPLPVLDPLRVEVERLEDELRGWDAACGALVVKVSAEEATVSTLRERHDSLSAGEWKGLRAPLCCDVCRETLREPV